MIRKITSLTLAWMFLVSATSGLVLFIAPPGRIAYWADWSIFGLTKTQWDHLHTVTTILMIIIVGLHLYYNWKPFTSYMKDKITKALSMTRELLISLVIVLGIALLALTQTFPASFIINTGDYFSEEWEKSYGTPPYNHAELDSLLTFSKRLKLDYNTSFKLLKKRGYTFQGSDTLLEIATKNGVSPQIIYKLIGKKGQMKPSQIPVMGSGVGNKTLKQVCELYKLDFPTVKHLLFNKNIAVNGNEKIKEIAARNNMNPMDLMEMILKSKTK